ncbi:MAG: ATP-binding protein [Bacteroidales bacterium]|nr:ATP-binding protein [Bacteroidales bacterium]
MEYKSKNYIQTLIQEGEHEHQDFKYQISDAKKIARSISAFANNSGGWLLIGVKDNGKIAGVSSDEEIYMVEQAAQMYCRPSQAVKCSVYRIEGKIVVKADIAEAKEKPVKAPDENDKWRTYIRRADENIEASSLHVKVLKQKAEKEDSAPLVYSENEHTLLDYLATHGGITLEGYMKLTHISYIVAETSAANLCRMGVIELTYHDGKCIMMLAD